MSTGFGLRPQPTASRVPGPRQVIGSIAIWLVSLTLLWIDTAIARPGNTAQVIPLKKMSIAASR